LAYIFIKNLKVSQETQMKEGEASQSVRKFSVKAEDIQIDD